MSPACNANILSSPKWSYGHLHYGWLWNIKSPSHHHTLSLNNDKMQKRASQFLGSWHFEEYKQSIPLKLKQTHSFICFILRPHPAVPIPGNISVWVQQRSPNPSPWPSARLHPIRNQAVDVGGWVLMHAKLNLWKWHTHVHENIPSLPLPPLLPPSPPPEPESLGTAGD